MLCCTAVMLLFGCECDARQVLLSEHEKLLQQLEALRERDHQQHQQQQQQQHVLHDSAPKKFLEVEHTNGSCNSSGEGSGWTEVSLAPQVMEMKQASCCGADTFFLCSTLSCSNHMRVVVTLCGRPTLQPRASDASCATSTLVHAAAVTALSSSAF